MAANIVKSAFRKVLESSGRQIIRYPDRDLMRRMKLIEHFKINKIFDVGANDGFFTSQMVKLGFKGEIISFEPVKSVFLRLKENSSRYPNWRAENFGLGSVDEQMVINVAGNSGASSSILPMTSKHLDACPEGAYVGKETITVRRLDSIFEDYYRRGDHILLKMDTQGFEKNVLVGAHESLEKIKGIQIELSLVELYEGQMLYREGIEYLEQRGFRLYSIENGFYNKHTGQLLAMDGILYRD